MIGNDIIDLVTARAESNWKRKGFLQKLFTPLEQLLIMSDLNPETKVWDLWSRKEAVYKIYNRETKIRAFMPLLINLVSEYRANEFLYAKMRIQNRIFYTKTKTTTDFIITIASDHKENIERIQEINPFEANRLIIKDKIGLPYQLNLLTLEKKVLSISHHGRFCSYITT